MKWFGALLIVLCSSATAEIVRSISLDQILLDRISHEWERPVDINDKASVEVTISFDRDGKIKSARVNRSSGASAYDSSVIMAIVNTGQLPEIKEMDIDSYTKWYTQRRMILRPADLEIQN